MQTLNPSLTKILNILGIRKFNHLQQLVEDEGFFTNDKDFTIVSQSRTGKSFTGALLIANDLFQKKEKQMTDGGKDVEEEIAIFITPFHASARDFYSILLNYFGWFLKPFIVLEEIRKAELILRISKGNPPNIIIATPESMRLLLRNKNTRTWLMNQKISSIVFDDVHSIIYQQGRGMKLYEVVSFFKTRVTPKPRIITLSAQFDNPERLGELFGGAVIEDNKKYGTPEIKLVNYETPKEKMKIMADNLENLAEDGTRTLIFMNSINRINDLLENYGEQLGEATSYDIDHIIKERLIKISDILDELEYLGSSYIRDGIGCDHGLMEETQRWFIEWAFRRKYLRLLFGTQALAFGVNTPVEHVIMGSPGFDDIFRQSMMSRAVWMRRGKGRPGDCTILTKSDLTVEELEETFSLPEMRSEKIKSNYMSNYLLGMIGLGMFQNESEIDTTKQELKLFYKWVSVKRGLKKLLEGNYPLISKTNNGKVSLTTIGEIAFESSLSGDQVERILDGIYLLAESGGKITDFDLLLIMNYGMVLDEGKTKGKKELNDAFQSNVIEKISFSLSKTLLDTEKEKIWKKAIEYSALMYFHITKDETYRTKIRKSPDRLIAELRGFSIGFQDFLSGLIEKKVYNDNKKAKKTIEELLKLMKTKFCEEIVIKKVSGKEHSLKGKDLEFVDFGNIEQSIDKTLDSNLSALQKIQLIELLESVESTTSAFVELMKRSKDDPEALEVLSTVCSFSKEGQVGKNLIKALVEEGVLEGTIVDQLSKQFTKGMDVLKKKFGVPASATKVMVKLFTGNIIGATMAGIDLIKPTFKGEKVDTDGIS